MLHAAHIQIDASGLPGLELTRKGGVVYDKKTFRTSLPGVFAAGDCRAKEVRQLTTAVADGAVAGLAAAEFAETN